MFNQQIQPRPRHCPEEVTQAEAQRMNGTQVSEERGEPLGRGGGLCKCCGKEFKQYSKCKVKPLEGFTVRKDLSSTTEWEWTRRVPVVKVEEKVCSYQGQLFKCWHPPEETPIIFPVEFTNIQVYLMSILYRKLKVGLLSRIGDLPLYWIRNQNHYQGHVQLLNYTGSM